MLKAFGVSDIGCVRSGNQDRILVDDSLGLFLVADGMGGHGHGETAAELAITTTQFYVSASRDRFDVSWPFGYDANRSVDENRLHTAVQLANRQVWKKADEAPEYAGMGTTIVSALINEDRAAIGHVGDSRIWLMRDGDLVQLTADDSWVAGMVRSGALDAKEAKEHSMRSVLTQAVGSSRSIEVHTAEHVLQSGDILLLTTDGIHGMVDEAVLRSVLFNCTGVDQAAKQLVQAALNNGGPDNASCVLVQYQS
ncbi:MAG TPA: protein phosphatase 2C domain-containing protein [Bryobacteraceae bacterium]|nr:protein phosphatase 2C domain-containing protein [Bryobacteraceae bacterium]